jgi:acyl-CoA reductase-like NAD-dependent aldehyde dehydrogenase
MLQRAIVAVVVLGAFIYAGWALMPARSRARLASRLADATGRGSGLLARLALRLERDTRTQLSDCGDCASNLDNQAKETQRRKPRPD